MYKSREEFKNILLQSKEISTTREFFNCIYSVVFSNYFL